MAAPFSRLQLAAALLGTMLAEDIHLESGVNDYPLL